MPLDDVTLEDCRLGDMRGVLPLFEQLGLKTLTVRLLQLFRPARGGKCPRCAADCVAG
ncbi:MAG: hypothetical protein ACLR4A_15280 [Christensenellales bacterium]